MDFSFLTQARGVEVPDPLETYKQTMTLAQIARASQLQQFQIREHERAEAAARGVGEGLGQLNDPNDDSQVRAIFQKLPPEARQSFLKAVHEAREKRAEIDYKRSQTRKNDNERQHRDAGMLSAEAGWLAEHPRLSPEMTGKFMQKLSALGLQDVVTPIPFQDWSDPEKARQGLAQIANSFYSMKDRVAQKETGRHHGAMEGHQAATLAETISNNAAGRQIQQDQLGVSRGNLDVARGNLQLSRDRAARGEWVNDLDRGVQVNMQTGDTRPIVAAGQPVGLRKDAKTSGMSERALAILDQAEPLLAQATGSYAGAGIDAVARGAGFSTPGAQATSQLKVLESALMMNQPRMEGPQSNLDVELYRQAAGKIGDPTVPPLEKKAALKSIRALHEKYAQISGGASPAMPPPSGDPRRGESRGRLSYSVGQSLDRPPDPASMPIGTVIKSDNGTVYVNDGTRWKRR